MSASERQAEPQLRAQMQVRVQEQVQGLLSEQSRSVVPLRVQALSAALQGQER